MAHLSRVSNKRTVLVLAVLVALAVFVGVQARGSVLATPTLTQVVPYTGASNQSDEFRYQDAYITTPDVSLASGEWAATPNGVTDWSGTFVESGAIERGPSGSPTYHPYASWDSSVDSGFQEQTGTNLSAGEWYQYKVIQFNSTEWQAVFCDGGGCGGIVSVDLGVGYLPFAASGAEAYPYTTSFGDITSWADYAYKNGSYVYWCYSSVMDNVGGGHTGSCDTTEHRWTVSY